MWCPKCHAPMHTYNRNGVQIEQCSGCRGIFLDYGELESLTRLEGQWVQQGPPPQPYPQQGYPAPAPHAPSWGAPQPHHGGHNEHYGYDDHGHRRHKSFGHMLFSS
ncbi:TFIIB-type zinc ribbon-containing protein [Streptomyces mauvecolor]